MTTTNVIGILDLHDGSQLLLQGEPTDGVATELQVLDQSNALSNIAVAALKKAITRIRIQASDGSIVTTLIAYKNGAATHTFYGGERIAASPEKWNLDIRGIAIPVDDTFSLKINCAD